MTIVAGRPGLSRPGMGPADACRQLWHVYTNGLMYIALPHALPPLLLFLALLSLFLAQLLRDLSKCAQQRFLVFWFRRPIHADFFSSSDFERIREVC